MENDNEQQLAVSYYTFVAASCQGITYKLARGSLKNWKNLQTVKFLRHLQSFLSGILAKINCLNVLYAQYMI